MPVVKYDCQKPWLSASSFFAPLILPTRMMRESGALGGHCLESKCLFGIIGIWCGSFFFFAGAGANPASSARGLEIAVAVWTLTGS